MKARPQTAFVTPREAREERKEQVSEETTSKQEKRIAFVDQCGTFHCSCGARHSRGPIDGGSVWRCLRCGMTARVRGVVELTSNQCTEKLK